MRILRIFFTALLLTLSVAAFAQAQDDDPGTQIGDLRSQLDQVEKAMKDENITDSGIDDLRGKAGDIAGKSQKVSSALSPNRDAAKAREREPTLLVERAVGGMIPRGNLGRAVLSKLRVYASAEHPHAAQKPEPLPLV